MALKFKLMKGSHVEGRKRYAEGSIVESDHDLVKTFPNKFQLVAETQSDAPVTNPRRISRPATDPSEEDTISAPSTMDKSPKAEEEWEKDKEDDKDKGKAKAASHRGKHH